MHILPHTTAASHDEPLFSTLLSLSNINLILWLLINYNDLHGGQKHERLLLRREKQDDGRCRLGYGIIVPAACHPDSVSVLQRGLLLEFGWMGDTPKTGEEPNTSFVVPGDGHGGSFLRFGWVDEMPVLLDYVHLPQTPYRGPSVEWLKLSKELRKLHGLHDEQDVFEDLWKDASKEVGPRSITE